MALTEVREKILRNVGEGKDPYDGFTGSQLGGAIRSFHTWREAGRFFRVQGDKIKLSEAGARAVRGKS